MPAFNRTELPTEIAMIIPVVWKEYSCVLSGSAFKFVECEKCQQRYVYQMSRHVQGTGNSLYFLDNAGAEDRARNTAATELQTQLDNDCDPVPCISCGWYQANMQTKLRNEHQIWLFYMAIALIIPFIILTLLAYLMFVSVDPHPVVGAIFLVADGVVVSVAIGAILIRKHLASKLEPNGDPIESRMQLARLNAITVAAFEELAKKQGVDWKAPTADNSQFAAGDPSTSMSRRQE